MAKPPFPWIGSKEKIAPYILQLFPPKLTQYVEPFGGSGAVLLALYHPVSTHWSAYFHHYSCSIYFHPRSASPLQFFHFLPVSTVHPSRSTACWLLLQHY